ncbi:MAG: response regulator [Spirochaetaceae bacterium]
MSKRILLVEDEALIAMAEAQMLKQHGYEVVTAHNGKKAIEAVDSDPEISLILMDIDLGTGMDGTEAAETILTSRYLPIVFLTSHSEKEYVDRVKKISGYASNRSPGFGLTIVSMLVEQLDGTYRIERDNGTKSVLSFPVHAKS